MLVETVQVSVDRCGLVAVDAENVANALPIRCGDEHTSTRPDNTPHLVEHSLRFWEIFDDFGRNSTVERSVGKRESLAVCDDCFELRPFRPESFLALDFLAPFLEFRVNLSSSGRSSLARRLS